MDRKEYFLLSRKEVIKILSGDNSPLRESLHIASSESYTEAHTGGKIDFKEFQEIVHAGRE
jgi:hypothetical protein